MSAAAAVAAALPNKEPPLYAGATTTMMESSLLTSGRAPSILVRPNVEAGISSAACPSPPLTVRTPDITLRNDDGGKSSTRTVLSVAATNASAAILWEYCAEVVHEHV